MIQQQVRPWEVLDDRVLGVLGEVAREVFVPDAYRGLAYADIEVPLGEGRAVLAPKVAGRLLQAVAVQPGDRVLELGTGSGYLSACLSRLGGRVVSLESDPGLAAAARERLTGAGFERIEVRCVDALADALSGATAGGPFEVIVVSGALPGSAVLGVLEGQLAPGGRLCCVLGGPPVMTAWLITQTADGLHRRSLFETCIPALANYPAPAVFVF